MIHMPEDADNWSPDMGCISFVFIFLYFFFTHLSTTTPILLSIPGAI